MSNFKTLVAYQYHHSNKVGGVLITALGNDFVCLQADVEAKSNPEGVTPQRLVFSVSVRCNADCGQM